jgi:glycosyltransferase involved in cell wall biosynthesis/GT2 family glycosyltransferase
MILKAVATPGRNKLFDLGCATGTFLEMARFEGFEVAGSEINSSAAEVGRKKGLSIEAGPFDVSAWPATSFDVITAFEVLEHVRDVRSVLLDLKSLLRDDGVFCFFVPNVPQALVEAYGDDLTEFRKSLEHTLYFNPPVLQTIVEEVFGEGSLELLVADVQDVAQTVSYALGIVRPGKVTPAPEDHLLPLLLGSGSLEGLDDDAVLAVALTAAKFSDFERADEALAWATDKGVPAHLRAPVQAQVMRNKGEILAAIGVLEDVIHSNGLEVGGLAGSLLIEVLEDLWRTIGLVDSGFGAGARELHALLSGDRTQMAPPNRLGLEGEIRSLWERIEVEILGQRALLEQAAVDRERNEKARIMAEARLVDARQSLAVVEARAYEFRSDSERLRADLDAIYRSRAWRLIGTFRQGKKAVTRVVRLPQTVLGSKSAGSIAGSETGASSIGTRRASMAPLVKSYPVAVSVIMPVYNKGRDLLAAIDSVFHQTFRNVEVVVWDDGSNELATLDALEEAAALDRVTVFRATNQGVIAARNAAMTYARGRYFMCLDPDDAIHPTYIEKAMALLENDPSTAIAYPWQRSVGDKAEIWETRDLDHRLIVEVNHVPVCAVFRREVFLETGGFSEVMAGGYEDWEFWAHAAELGFRGRVIPEPLFVYSHSQSKDESRDASAREMHLALATEIGKLHPLLVGKRVIPQRRSVTSEDPGSASREIEFPRGSGTPILLLLPWFTVGGADTVVERLLSEWRAQGRTVVVCTTTDLAPGMVDRSLDLFDYTPYVYQLHRLLPERSWMGFVAGIVAALGEPVVFNVGAAWFYEFADSLRELHPGVRLVDQQFNDMGHADGNRAAAHAIDVTVVAYQRLAEVFLVDGRPPNSVEVVYTGIVSPDRPSSSERERVRSELNVEAGEKLVAFVGRFSDEKRPGWIPKVADALGERYRLVVVGDGPLAEEMAAELERRPRLKWLRRTDSIDEILNAADVVMIPSNVEGIPLVALEALALGTPVVATAVGGLPELAGTPGVSLVGKDDLAGFVAAIQAAAGGDSEGRIQLPDRFQETFMAKRYDEVISR